MEVGILFTSHPDPETEPYPHQAIHARTTEEILEAEALGFDSVWIAEHHFSNRYGILPDPFSYLAYLAEHEAALEGREPHLAVAKLLPDFNNVQHAWRRGATNWRNSAWSWRRSAPARSWCARPRRCWARSMSSA